MGGLEHEGCMDARPIRLHISSRTDTPLIPWLESGESELRRGGAQVISDPLLELEELLRDPNTSRVLPSIFSIGFTAPVPEKSGQGISRACSKGGS